MSWEGLARQLRRWLTQCLCANEPGAPPFGPGSHDASHLGFLRNARPAGSTIPAVPEAVGFADVIAAVGTCQKEKS